MTTSQPIYQTAETDVGGNVMFTFPQVPQGYVSSGTVQIPQAPGLAQWESFFSGAPYGTWTGSNPWGPIEAASGVTLSIAGTGLFPSTAYQAIWTCITVPTSQAPGGVPTPIQSSIITVSPEADLLWEASDPSYPSPYAAGPLQLMSAYQVLLLQFNPSLQADVITVFLQTPRTENVPVAQLPYPNELVLPGIFLSGDVDQVTIQNESGTVPGFSLYGVRTLAPGLRQDFKYPCQNLNAASWPSPTGSSTITVISNPNADQQIMIGAVICPAIDQGGTGTALVQRLTGMMAAAEVHIATVLVTSNGTYVPIIAEFAEGLLLDPGTNVNSTSSSAVASGGLATDGTVLYDVCN
jgi:hypothetical protein